MEEKRNIIKLLEGAWNNTPRWDPANVRSIIHLIRWFLSHLCLSTSCSHWGSFCLLVLLIYLWSIHRPRTLSGTPSTMSPSLNLCVSLLYSAIYQEKLAMIQRRVCHLVLMVAEDAISGQCNDWCWWWISMIESVFSHRLLATQFLLSPIIHRQRRDFFKKIEFEYYGHIFKSFLQSYKACLLTWLNIGYW